MPDPQKYDARESIDRIYRILKGETLSNDAPESLPLPRYSTDELLSRLAELLQGSLPGETLTIPTAADIADASTTQKGVVELATDAETAAGADTTRALVPSSHLYAHGVGIGAERLGSGVNYVDVQSDGQITFEGDARLAKYLTVPIGSMMVGAIDYPGLGAFKGGTQLYWFDKETPENLYFTVALPAGYEASSDISVYVDWVPKSTELVTGTVSWGLEYTLGNFGEASPEALILYSNDANDPMVTQNVYYSTFLGRITGTVAAAVEWDYIVGRVFRDASGTYAVDDYDDDAGMLGVTFMITEDSLGVVNELV